MSNPVQYEFLIAGELSTRVMAAFPEFHATHRDDGKTALLGPVRNHSSMRAVLARIDSLGLTIEGLRRVTD